MLFDAACVAQHTHGLPSREVRISGRQANEREAREEGWYEVIALQCSLLQVPLASAARNPIAV